MNQNNNRISEGLTVTTFTCQKRNKQQPNVVTDYRGANILFLFYQNDKYDEAR
jgi:hypothetical protein